MMFRRATLSRYIHRSLSRSALRHSSTTSSGYESAIYEKLNAKLHPEELEVRDISGGCGSMFAISVVSKKFEGLTTIKQHRLVNEILKDDISQWHGLQLRTRAK